MNICKTRSQRPGYFLAALFLGVAAHFSSCISGGALGTTVKTLGVTSASSTRLASADIDVFALTLAFRDNTDTTNRTVVVQGVRNNTPAHLVNVCGSFGEKCTCEFYQTLSVTSAVTKTNTIGISDNNNSLSCTIAGTVTPSNFKTVRVVTIDGKSASALIPIETKLSLSQIIGGLSNKKVRKIMRYSCTRSFFEGEGVTSAQISCTSGQHLGIITADYDFYLYSSQVDNNVTKKGGDTAWPNVCNFPYVPLQVNCGNSVPSVRFGLYSESAEPFTVAVSMSANSTPTSTEVYGFAALPDSAGNCPIGLIKVRPWVAQPASMVHPTNCLQSNFINTNGSLNNTIVEEATASPTPTFAVTVQPSIGNIDCGVGQTNSGASASTVNCRVTATTTKGVGDCSEEILDAATVKQTVNYTPLSPIVCAISKDYLNGF